MRRSDKIEFAISQTVPFKKGDIVVLEYWARNEKEEYNILNVREGGIVVNRITNYLKDLSDNVLLKILGG